MLNFGIENKIFDRKGYVIAISKFNSKEKFIEVVKPHMCPTMTYKISGSLRNHGRP